MAILEQVMSEDEAKKVIVAVRRAAIRSFKKVGAASKIGDKNLDDHRLSKKDVVKFAQDFDKATRKALEAHFVIV